MKALVLFSGGVDSTTCLATAIDRFGKNNVIALSIRYGQKHIKEIEASNKIARYYDVEHIELDLTEIFKYSNCSLLSQSNRDIPHESYADQLSKTNGSPVSTYVPFRNGLFLSCASSIALSKGCTRIYYGAHSDDAVGNAYPDCSKKFNDAISNAIFEGSGHQLFVVAPFVGLTNKEVVALGVKLHVPYQLTWSCYEGKDEPCKVCGTCRDRREAFLANGLDLY